MQAITTVRRCSANNELVKFDYITRNLLDLDAHLILLCAGQLITQHLSSLAQTGSHNDVADWPDTLHETPSPLDHCLCRARSVRCSRRRFGEVVVVVIGVVTGVVVVTLDVIVVVLVGEMVVVVVVVAVVVEVADKIWCSTWSLR